MEATKLPAVAVSVSGPSLAPPQTSEATSFEGALAQGCLDAALRLLNSRTRHRFTSILSFDPPMLYSFDRECDFGTPPRCVALDETYAEIVMQTEKPFFTEAAQYDARLMSHPARGSISSYMGVPLRDANGNVFGVLFHHDDRPRAAPLSELEALTRASSSAAQWLVATGGPAPR